MTWGAVFRATGTQRGPCPGCDEKVQAGDMAKGASDGRVWHDDCAEAAGAYGPVFGVFPPATVLEDVQEVG